MGVEHDFTNAISKLEEMEKKLAREVSDKALKAGAKEVLSQQKINVPVDSGELRQSLYIDKPKGGATKRKITVGINPVHPVEVRYGYYQEYGTSTMLGSKWMKQAQKKSREASLNAISEVLKNEIGGN